MPAFNSGSFTQLQLGGPLRGDQYDALDVGGELAFGGTLTISLINDFNPVTGASFILFDFDTTTGSFDTFSLPDLDPGLAWDTTALYSLGTLSVTAIPEPSTYAALAGLLALGLALRRRKVAGG